MTVITCWYVICCDGIPRINTYRRQFRDMAQAVSRQPLTPEVRVRALSVHVAFIMYKVELGQDFLSSSVFTCLCHSTVPLYTHMSSGGWTGGCSSETQSHSVDMNNSNNERASSYSSINFRQLSIKMVVSVSLMSFGFHELILQVSYLAQAV
jgi:hypothetical protein